MSLLGFQTAVAACIRHPRVSYEWKSDFLDKFELTDPERKIVEKLSRHEELNKYGHDQAKGRLETTLNHIDRVPNFIPDRVLKNIWFDLYEPTAIFVQSDLKGEREMSISFLKFLLASKDAQKRLRRCTPFFINDLIEFEIAELELCRDLRSNPPLCAGSTINNPNFRIVDLDFDTPGWLGNPEEEDVTKFERSLTLAFVRNKTVFPKMYEITKEFKTFLLSQIGEGEIKEASSEMKSDLVKMGLIV